MKNKTWKIILCAVAIVCSALSAAIGYGFMGGTDLSFLVKFSCGFVFMATPLLVIQLVILLWKKNG